MRKSTGTSLALLALMMVHGPTSHADSVAQVGTSKFLADETVQALTCRVDPDRGGTGACNSCTAATEFCSNPTPNTGGDGGTGGTRTAIRPGDILTFRMTFTPIPNGGRMHGLAGYLTEYVPPNTEVVGARMVDRAGNTVLPRRAGLGQSGWGGRGSRNWSGIGLTEGTIAQVYCDTGIFYSTDSRTAQRPADALLTVTNGIQLAQNPTGVGGFDQFIGAAPPYFAHNEWDAIQVYAFGVSSSQNAGTGVTAFGYGSAVAGPKTFYQFEAGSNASPPTTASETFTGAVGPWQRVRYPGSETCTGSAATAAGAPIRIGTPTNEGFDLSTTNPLPSGTNTVRFAIGELIVGEEYFAEVSLRVKSVPLHPTLGNVNCSEVFGGDAAVSTQETTSNLGKDNTWRYFLPAPSCTNIDVFFSKSVNKSIALGGQPLTYTLKVINLSRMPQTNVVITDTIDSGATFVSATGDGAIGMPTRAGNLLTWPTLATLAPGEQHSFQVVVNASNAVGTLNQALYNSTELTGYRAVAFTNSGALALIHQNKTVAPQMVNPGGTVTYTVTVKNDGTATTAAGGRLVETLPTGFTIVAGSTTVGAAPFANPSTNTDGDFEWTGLPAIAAGATQVIAFQVAVGSGVTPGVFRNTFRTVYHDNGSGEDLENKFFNVTPLFVGVTPSALPTINTPIYAGATTVSGTSSEANGTVIRVRINGIERGNVTVTGGTWSVSGLPRLFVGQRVTVTAQAPSEVEGTEAVATVQAAPLGATPTTDGGVGDGSPGDGGTNPNSSDGCGCSIGGVATPFSFGIGLLVVLGLLLSRRGRR